MKVGVTLSVLIPTHGRPTLLGRTLASLAACRLPEGYREAVVVENGSRAGAEAVVAEAARAHPGLRLRYLSGGMSDEARMVDRYLLHGPNPRLREFSLLIGVVRDFIGHGIAFPLRVDQSGTASLVAVGKRPCGDVASIRSCPGFGKAIRSDDLAARHLRQVVRFLLLGAVHHDSVTAARLTHKHCLVYPAHCRLHVIDHRSSL